MTDIQYGIKIMGGREVSRPYRFFSPKASGFYPFGDATALAGEGGVGDVVWLIQASASNHKPKGRFFWFVVWFVPDALIHLHCCLRQKQTKRTALWFENPPIIIPNAQLPGHIQCHHIVNGFKNKMIS